MKAPNYGLGLDMVTSQIWAVRFRAPFMVFLLDPVDDHRRFHNIVFQEASAPSRLVSALAAYGSPATMEYRYFLPDDLTKALNQTISALPRANAEITGGCSVRSITRPGLLVVRSERGFNGILDMRSMASLAYASIDPDAPKGHIMPFKDFFRMKNGMWVRLPLMLAKPIHAMAAHWRMCETFAESNLAA